MNNKGQSALEYLFTYGWALVVIVIVVAALFMLGILNPATYQQKTCTGFSRLAYQDHALHKDNNTFDIRFRNGTGSDINITDLTLSNSSQVNVSATDTATYGNVVAAGAAQTLTYNADSAALVKTTHSVGDPYDMDVKITYTQNGISHTEQGKCTGQIEN